MAQQAIKATAFTEKVKESSIEKIFRLLKVYIPEEEISLLKYNQSVGSRGKHDSTLTFERTIPKSTLNLNKDIKEYLDSRLPEVLVRYIKSWHMHDTPTHLICKYEIVVLNATAMALAIEKNVYDKYNKEFDAEIDKTLKSE